MLKKVQWKPLIISLMISLGTGFLSGFVNKNSVKGFETLVKPPLTPPSFVFPIAWTILYILMGISAYLVYISCSEYREKALRVYLAQLIVNFLWTIVFFNLEMRLLAFIWLLILWVLIIRMIRLFYKVDPLAAYLQIPYLIWVTFAGYLNLATYLLNR
jgi:Tryptophan-rich sensory protein (mitochondrial benzodiazepine receptor homolog)